MFSKSKITALVITALFLFSGCNFFDGYREYPKFGGLKGNVKSYVYSSYSPKEGNKAGELLCSESYDFDKDGNLIKYVLYDTIGNREYEEHAFYVNGHCSRIECECFDLPLDYYWGYHLAGNRQKATVTMKERTRKHALRSIAYEDGTEDVTFESLETVTEGKKKTLKNQRGVILSETTLNKKGFPLEQKTFLDGELFNQVNLEYDKDNQKVKRIDSFKDQEPIVHTYSYPDYDNKGNWIICYEYQGEEIVSIIKRSIIYR